MATDYTHVPQQASVSEVLKLVVLEHHELRAQYKEVTTRIRNLRIAVRTLRSLGGGSAPAARQEKTKVCGENEFASDPVEVRTDPDSNRQSADSQDLALRRAIRIAVFETFDVVSSQEVHARILRRGSFSFPNDDLAVQAIAEELRIMTEQGELRRVESVAGSGWQRV
ncbi:MAG TPA: hypothetical protein VHW45_10400 [Candidatus Sulfotelmatobacter sp.]|nr:hypothetical protein [Candidatus Sulfotelmatobacter sp.]